MVLNVALRRIPPALALFLGCALGTVLVQAELARLPGNPQNFSPIFHYLLNSYDTHGNFLLLALVFIAFLLRRQPAVAGMIRFAGGHPWRVAAVALPLFCLGALTVYHDYPLSMDEYVALFQAQAFAAGKLGGQFPPELLDQLLPRMPKNYFFVASAASGVVSGSYWPGFALVLAPFAWIGAPWAANPLISALTLPALHRLTREISGSREAAGWAVALTLASPVFVVSAMSYYSMPAHLLCNLLYVLLLLRPTIARALLAGLVGSLALTLHNPAPHLLFAIAVFGWLVVRRTPFATIAALLAGYLPLTALLGYGWPQHLAALAAAGVPPSGPSAAPAMSLLERAVSQVATFLKPPSTLVIEARIAGLTKVWTWGTAALLLLAAYGYALARALPGIKMLGAALLLTFFAFFFVPFDQGHGWGYRYLHSAWFVLPVFAALALVHATEDGAGELRNMAAWGIALSLVFANALRLVQVDAFIGRHLHQVPPLALPADPSRAEIIFIDPTAGFYSRDMVHNDPFLGSPRLCMVYDGPQRAAALMAQRFPAYTRRAEGKWGELWTK
ncbi:MAG TPA: hypothetical protein VMJ14_08705 [Burkholderiales bacterium]|nr:hypothetical protein [Burkholderiales bacterium]